MDQLYDVFKLYADQFAKIPMFPLLQCVHYTIMNLKLRMGEGKSFNLSLCTGQIEVSTSPPGTPREFDSLLCPGSREFDSLSLRRGGEFENRMGRVGNLNKLPRCHVTSALVRDENMAEFTERLTLEDFRGQNCAFVCDWLQKRGLQKICSVFISKC